MDDLNSTWAGGLDGDILGDARETLPVNTLLRTKGKIWLMDVNLQAEISPADIIPKDSYLLVMGHRQNHQGNWWYVKVLVVAEKRVAWFYMGDIPLVEIVTYEKKRNLKTLMSVT